MENIRRRTGTNRPSRDNARRRVWYGARRTELPGRTRARMTRGATPRDGPASIDQGRSGKLRRDGANENRRDEARDAICGPGGRGAAAVGERRARQRWSGIVRGWPPRTSTARPANAERETNLTRGDLRVLSGTQPAGSSRRPAATRLGPCAGRRPASVGDPHGPGVRRRGEATRAERTGAGDAPRGVEDMRRPNECATRGRASG